MSYPAKKSFAYAASILLLGGLLVGCQGGGGSGSGISNGGDSGSPDSGQDSSQQTASLAPDSARLTWDAPAERVNGDELKVGEIDHYVVSWGQDPDNLDNTAQIPCVNCVDMEYLIEGLDAGTWYFTVQTRDTDGNLSRQADLASKRI